MSSIRRNGAHIQRLRIRQIAKNLAFQIKTGGGEVDLNYFKAYVQFNYGLNPRTTRNYLKTLELMRVCKVDDKNDIITEWFDTSLTLPEPKEEPKSPPEEKGGVEAEG